MHIAVDYQIFQTQVYGGISRYHIELGKALKGKNCQVDFFAPLYLNNYLKNFNSSNVKGFYVKNISKKTVGTLRHISNLLFLGYLRTHHPDIIHNTYFNTPALQKKGIPSVLTIHDMIHELYPESFSSQNKSIRLKKRAIHQADHIICISKNTYDDLLRIYDVPKDKVSIVHHGFNKISAPEVTLTDLKTEKPYLLFIGSREGYKNFDSLLKAYSSDKNLKQDFDIVCFGGGNPSKAEKVEIKKAGLQDKIHFESGDDTLLSIYYRNAIAFIYPSLYEGFGMPPLEAMSNNCPVIVSNTSSIPEIVGSAGKYFDPQDVESLQYAIKEVIYDEKLRSDFIKLGVKNLDRFSWSKCAMETKAVYQKLI